MSAIFSTKIRGLSFPDVNTVCVRKENTWWGDGGGGEISSSRNRQDETEWAGRIDLVARRRGFSVHVHFRFRLPLPFDRY